jgi:hypothetical protein
MLSYATTARAREVRVKAMATTLWLVVCLIVLVGVLVRIARIPVITILLLYGVKNLLPSSIGSLANAIHALVVVVYDGHRYIKLLARIKRYADH